MKQLLARIDERLHQRLRDRAARDGRSVNALVTEMLEKGLAADDPRAQWRAKLRELGMLVEPPRPEGPVPTIDELRARIPRAVRLAIIEAHTADRKHR